MKSIILLFSILLAFNSFASDQANKSLSAYELIKSLDSKIPVRYPNKMKKTKIENLKVNKNSMSFIMNGNSLQITFIGQKEKFLILNGMTFSYAELKDFKTIQSSLIRKFHLKRPQYSMFNLLFSVAHAEDFLAFPPLPSSSSEPVSNSSVPSGFSAFQGTQNSNGSQPSQFGFGNFRGLMSCLTGGCFQQGLIGISSFLEGLTNFGRNDRAFNEFFSMPDPTLIPAPQFSASPYSVR